MKKFSEIISEVQQYPMITILNPQPGQVVTAKCIAVNTLSQPKVVESTDKETGEIKPVIFNRFAKFNVRSEHQEKLANSMLETLCARFETNGDFEVTNAELEVLRAGLTRDIIVDDTSMRSGANVKLTLGTYHPKDEPTVTAPTINWAEVIEVKATTSQVIPASVQALLAKQANAQASASKAVTES